MKDFTLLELVLFGIVLILTSGIYLVCKELRRIRTFTLEYQKKIAEHSLNIAQYEHLDTLAKNGFVVRKKVLAHCDHSWKPAKNDSWTCTKCKTFSL